MSNIKIEIKTYWGEVLFEREKEEYTIKEALQDAVLQDAVLRGADLRGAVLRGADLRGADLRGAVLQGAVLQGAVLQDAVLRGADLRGAVLRGADLRGADLRGAVLRGADLQGIPFNQLPKQYIELCSRDMLYIFKYLESELPGLRKALIAGKINGTQYEGDCACLIGTLGGNTDEGADKVCEFIPYYSKGLQNPSEQWFWQIREGDTPKNSAFAKHALMLIDMVMPAKKAKK